MKKLYLASLLGIAALAGCATTAPGGMVAGQFVNYECEGGKRFQARLAADGSSVRIRYEGGYELDHKGNGVYEGEGFRLTTQGGVELSHHGKVTHKACKRV
jgi:hypothetical protein